MKSTRITSQDQEKLNWFFDQMRGENWAIIPKLLISLTEISGLHIFRAHEKFDSRSGPRGPFGGIAADREDAVTEWHWLPRI